ncbi:MAG: hypothetical protein ACOC0U_05505 [Desulfovibrionales bacterium]
MSHLTETFYVSLGYLFNSLEGTSDFDLNTTSFNSPFDMNWFTRDVDIDRDSHVVNTNVLFGPWKDFTLYGGVEEEQTDRDGDTDAVLTEIGAGLAIDSPEADIVSRTETTAFEETVGARYKGIPHTTVYAEGKFKQQDIEVFERQIEDAALGFERFTERDVNRKRYKVGFNTSPVTDTRLSASYGKSYQSND